PQIHLSRVTAAQLGGHLDAEVTSFFNVVAAALPHLRRSEGCLVAVTSVAVHRYPRRDALSAGPKAAVEALVRAMAAEEGRYGVRANCVAPGMLADGMAAELRRRGDMSAADEAAALAAIPLRRFGRADDVADAVAFLASAT